MKFLMFPLSTDITFIKDNYSTNQGHIKISLIKYHFIENI